MCFPNTVVFAVAVPETQQITRKTTIPLTIPKKQSNLASEVTSTQVADDSTKRRKYLFILR